MNTARQMTAALDDHFHENSQFPIIPISAEDIGNWILGDLL
jgi:hypothetical protein